MVIALIPSNTTSKQSRDFRWIRRDETFDVYVLAEHDGRRSVGALFKTKKHDGNYNVLVGVLKRLIKKKKNLMLIPLDSYRSNILCCVLYAYTLA